MQRGLLSMHRCVVVLLFTTVVRAPAVPCPDWCLSFKCDGSSWCEHGGKPKPCQGCPEVDVELPKTVCLSQLHASNVPWRDEGANGIADPQLWVYEGQGGPRQETAVQMNNEEPRWAETICVSTEKRDDQRVCFDIRDDYPFDDDAELLAFGCAPPFTANDLGKTHRVQVGGATVHFALSTPAAGYPECRDECQRNVMPRLPVLTADNEAEYPLWHAYIRRVYHQPVKGRVDLNTFSMFYHAGDMDGEPMDAVAVLFAENPCLRICTLESWPHRKPVYDGSVFVGDSGPEMRMNALGFFVHRPFLTRAAIEKCDRLEVMHLRTEWLGGEKGVSWFFNTVGSGIFLDCHAMRQEGGIGVYRNREEWEREHGREWPMDPNVLYVMEDEGLKLLVFTAADFTVFDADGNNPSTEIVVRHRARDSSEATSSRGSCLDDDDIGIGALMRTGVTGGLTCVCRKREPPLASINCDYTSQSS